LPFLSLLQSLLGDQLMAYIETRDGASEIYREENYRYVAIKYSVRGRDLGGAVKRPSRR